MSFYFYHMSHNKNSGAIIQLEAHGASDIWYVSRDINAPIYPSNMFHNDAFASYNYNKEGNPHKYDTEKQVEP